MEAAARRVPIVLLAVLAVAAAAPVSAATKPSLRFRFLPQQAFQGQVAAVTAAVAPRGTRCSLRVAYANGHLQAGLKPGRAKTGRLTWRWRVPDAAPVGRATVRVACSNHRKLTGTFGVFAGAATPPKVSVVKQGFSQRPAAFGGGSSVSYGFVLHDDSATADAVGVSVLVNAVDASDRVLGSTTATTAGIAAGTSFALGGFMTLPDQTAVSRLELTVHVGSPGKREVRYPATANLRLTTKSGYVSVVDGEVQNDGPPATLTSAKVYVVVMDSAGTIVGGSSGYVFSAVPAGSRIFFAATQGIDAVPASSASTVIASVDPRYAA